MEELCKLFGKSRQAWYKQKKTGIKQQIQNTIILEMVRNIRKPKPRCGVKKLYQEMKPDLKQSQIKVGRDQLFTILRENQLLIKKRRNRVKTTNSYHWLHTYSNLITEVKATRPNQIWVSDITYIKTQGGFLYLYLITDAYSRKIVGWNIASDLKAQNAVYALNQAIVSETITDKLIHHSDRGIQYCCKEYIEILKRNRIEISMTQNGDPRENAIAERVNGILKDEWINDLKLKSLSDAKRYIGQIIEIYNTDRLHSSINMLTPSQAHTLTGELKKHWKNYFKKRYKELIEVT